MQVRELVTRLGFDADEAAAKSYDNAIKNIRRTAIATTAAVAALSAATFETARRMANAGNDVAKAAVEAGMAADEFQRLTFAIGQVTRLSDQQAQQALMRLNDTIGRARIEGGRYAESLERLGFSQAEIESGTISNEEAFARVTEEIGKTANAQDAAALASRVLGERVGRQLGPALRENAADMVEQRKRAEELGGGWSDAALAASEDFVDSMGEVRLITTTVTSDIAERLLPAVRQTVDSFVEWWTANKELIRQRLDVYMEQVRRGADILRRGMSLVLDIFRRAIGFIGGFEKAIRLAAIMLGVLISAKIIVGVIKLAGAMRALGVASLFAARSMRRIPLVALAAGLAVLLEDVWAWAHGNESAIGRVIGSWGELREKVDGFWDGPEREVWSFGQAIDDALVGGIKAAWDGFKYYGQLILQWSENITRAVMGIIPRGLRERLGFDLDGGGGASDTVTMPESDMGRGVGQISRDVRVRADVSLQVPAGTTSDQRQSLERQVDALFRDRLDRELQNAVLDFSTAE